MKLAVEIESGLYRAIEFQAMRGGGSVEEALAKALEAWLEAIEDAEDIADATWAMKDYERDGGVSAEDVFASLDAIAREASPS